MAVSDGIWDWKTSFRPKNWEKPALPRKDGVVASSFTRMPLPPVPEMES